MATIRVKIEGQKEVIRKLRALGDVARQAIDDAAHAGAEVIRAEANRRAPGPHVHVKTAQITEKGLEVDIGPDEQHWYYRFFELGAQPHEITPSVRKALAFQGTEGEQFAARVKHPGMAAQPFMRPALDEKKDEAVRAVQRELEKAVRRLARSL